jgi:DcuC family C4-dicarboxylate transporter
MVVLIGLVIIVAAVYAVIRRVDVRLALLLAALALGALTASLPLIIKTFVVTLSNEKFVVPICCAMGFAYVLRQTECDQHLVRLLVAPLRRVRVFLIPGAVLVGFLVNIPVISQTSTAVAIGAVLVPLLRAARLSPVTAGAALLLGSSVGGELLNPGAPELRTVATTLKVETAVVIQRLLPLLLVQLGVATAVFWGLSVRAEAVAAREEKAQSEDRATATLPTREEKETTGITASPNTEVKREQGVQAQLPPEGPLEADQPVQRVNLFKAAVPLVPLVLLFLTGPPLQLVQVPREWLVDGPDQPFESRLIGAAMLIGVAVAALASWRSVPVLARSFFEGAGYAFTNIISLIVIAACFGKGVEQIGVAALLHTATTAVPGLLVPAAGGMPLLFAFVSGSGMAATQSLYGFFVEPARDLGLDPVRVGGVVSLGSAAGRTMSPVAAVTLMSAALTGSNPLDLVRRVAVPLLAGVAVMLVVAAVWLHAG